MMLRSFWLREWRRAAERRERRPLSIASNRKANSQQPTGLFQRCHAIFFISMVPVRATPRDRNLRMMKRPARKREQLHANSRKTEILQVMNG